MSKVPNPTEASAPHKTKTFAELAKALPEPFRHLVSSYAVEVYVECIALKVGAVDGARAARAHQLALLGEAAASAEGLNHEGISSFARLIDECNRIRACFRAEPAK